MAPASIITEFSHRPRHFRETIAVVSAVTLFIPVLNEIDGLRAIMPQIRRDWFDQILMG